MARPFGSGLTPLEVRFWRKVRKAGKFECWEWQGSRQRIGGYGRVWDYRLREKTGAHRIAWELANGPVPYGLFVLHHCDNGACCNPRHLFLGTQLANSMDKHQKGRANMPKGEEHWKAKLKASDVICIREKLAAGAGIRATAREYGVRHSLIQYIRDGGWAHI
jgi:hypothetical protein